MELVAFAGKDKDSWGQITALMNRGDWEKIIIVSNKNADGFPGNDKTSFVSIDSDKTMTDLRDEIKDKLKKYIGMDFEVALSLASGNGKEHMALVSALLNMPVGIKLVVYTKKGIEFLS